MTDALHFSGLSFSYKNGPLIFQDYQAGLTQGKVMSILGPNGRGKTTLLKVLLGLLAPINGTVRKTGQLSLVPQLFQVTFAFSVLDMVVMGRAKRLSLFARPGRRDFEIALAALDRFGIADLADRSFFSLSGGQRQLVIIARALVAEADILALDEPTSALDLRNQDLVLRWIEKLAAEDGLTILFTTHHPHHALAVSDQALLMIDAKKYLCGPAHDVLTGANLESLYGVPLKRLEFEYHGSHYATLVPVFLQRYNDNAEDT
jgi:iron complex transport system ATP-binding protein